MSTVVLPVDLVADVAVALTGDGRFALAAELLVGASTETAPLSAAAGMLALAQGDTAAAAASFEHALELDTACREARKGLADLAADLGDLDRAADCYEAVDTPPPVTIVIPVFNRLDLTKQCLEALSRTTPADLYEVIVVDNASTDGTTELLRRERAAGRLKAVLNDENLGFGRACNRAARLARGEYVLFLNNDTVPQAGWLEALVATAADPSVGAVGSRLLYPDGSLQHAGIVFEDGKPEHVHRRQPANFAPALVQQDYPAVTGACIIFRRELLEQLGGFNEAYTMYVEDVDLCLCVWDAGFRVVYEPASVLFHLESASVVDLERRDELVRAGWEIMRERWDGRWPAALPGGAPVSGTVVERIEGARGFAVLAFADELIADPSLLAAYATAFGPDDDATLVIYAPDSAPGVVEQTLGRALAAAGIDESGCPDLIAVSAPSAPAAQSHLARAVDAVFTRREIGGPFDRLPRYDADGLAALSRRALGASARLAA